MRVFSGGYGTASQDPSPLCSEQGSAQLAAEQSPEGPLWGRDECNSQPVDSCAAAGRSGGPPKRDRQDGWLGDPG